MFGDLGMQLSECSWLGTIGHHFPRTTEPHTKQYCTKNGYDLQKRSAIDKGRTISP